MPKGVVYAKQKAGLPEGSYLQRDIFPIDEPIERSKVRVITPGRQGRGAVFGSLPPENQKKTFAGFPDASRCSSGKRGMDWPH
jgi:hypothetical protein